MTRIDSEVDLIVASVEANETRLKEHDSRLAVQERSISLLSRESREALERAQAAEKLAQGKLLYEIVLTDDTAKFGFAEAQIQDSARKILDGLIQGLKAENRSVFIEIQGHTDAVGPEKYNYDLGLRRAEAVRRYLSESGIPLHRIAVISYGEERPVGDNQTREGRSLNRRVVIQVLA